MGEWKEKKNRAPDLKYLERESLKKGDSDTGTAADVELVMKKYDRESNTRVWQGKPASIIRWLSVLFSVYSIYVTLFSTALPEIRLSMFLGMILILGYLHYPIQKGDGRINHMPWYDWVLMAVGAVPFFYFAANAHAIIKLATRVTKNPVMVLMAILAVLSLMELCRRCVGIPILCVVGALLVYTFATVRFGKVIYDLVLHDERSYEYADQCLCKIYCGLYHFRGVSGTDGDLEIFLSTWRTVSAVPRRAVRRRWRLSPRRSAGWYRDLRLEILSQRVRSRSR